MANKEINISKNIQSWEEKIIQIFPMAIPNKCEWNDEMDMLNILFTLCYKNLNHIFYPDGQVLSLFGADFSKEDSCIELYTEKSIDIIKPKLLSFRYYEEAYSWSYFRVEIEVLNGVKNKSSLLIFAKESPFKWIYNKALNELSEEKMAKTIEDLIIEEC
ncbi:hypothetical protein [Terrisporobacter sp.]